MTEVFQAGWVVKEAKRRLLLKRGVNRRRNSAAYVQEKIQAEARRASESLQSAIVAEAKKQETLLKPVCDDCDGTGQTLNRKRKRKVCPTCGGSGKRPD